MNDVYKQFQNNNKPFYKRITISDDMLMVVLWLVVIFFIFPTYPIQTIVGAILYYALDYDFFNHLKKGE